MQTTPEYKVSVYQLLTTGGHGKHNVGTVHALTLHYHDQ